MDRPYIKFFFRDWEADEALQTCSLAAQGLWIHMLGQMHRAVPYGYFLTGKGRPVDIADFSRRKGQKVTEVRRWIAELESAGVFSRDAKDRIYSRRLVRDEQRRVKNARNGANGGNPLLLGISELDNQSDNRVGYDPGISESDKAIVHSSIAPESIDPRSDSLRSSALEFRTWPEDVERLRALAAIFVERFANADPTVRGAKYLGDFTGLLATFRSRNVPIDTAWNACEDALKARRKPLFGAAVKTALSYLPARVTPAAAALRNGGAPIPASEYQRYSGDDHE